MDGFAPRWRRARGGARSPDRRVGGVEALESRRLLTAVVSGERVEASIANVGDTVTYTFDASAGDAVSAVVGATGGAGFVPRLQIVAPDGSPLTPLNNAVDVVNLALSGEYSIVVSELGNNDTGTFALSFFRTPATQPTTGDSGPVSTGQRLIGSIDPGDLDVYTFDVNAGDSVSAIISVTGGAGFIPILRVFDPDGAPVTGFLTATDQVDLAQAGAYTILVRESGDNDTGTYAISFFRAPAAQPVDSDSGPIASGQRLSGSIDAGDLDVYTFDAGAGDSISAVIGATGGAGFLPLIRIFHPDGSPLSDFAASTDHVSLAQTGTYTILVRESGNNHVGTYALSLGRFPATQQPDTLDNDGGPIASGQTTSGAITSGDIDVYTLSLTAGSSVMIQSARLTGTDFVPRIDLFSPSGERLSVQSGDPAAITLPSAPLSGTYYLVARESGDDDVGNYSIGIDVAPGPDTRPPQVTQAQFLFEGPRQQIVFTLNESISGSLDVSDLTLENLTTSQTIPAADIDATFNPLSNGIVIEFPSYPFGVLPDGDYRATLNAGSVEDAAGNALPANSSFEFFFLQGDANRDRRVNLADFNILATHFGRNPARFPQADFNYDGQTNLADFNILAARFGNMLSPAAANETVTRAINFGERTIDVDDHLAQVVA